MQYRHAFGVNTSLVRLLCHPLFRVICGTIIALVALLSPASMAAASMHAHSLTKSVVVGTTNSGPQVQAVYGTNGSFTSNTANLGGVSASSLWGPDGVRFDNSANLYVADLYNNRVLYYPAGGSTTAIQVYGQGGNFTSTTANSGG